MSFLCLLMNDSLVCLFGSELIGLGFAYDFGRLDWLSGRLINGLSSDIVGCSRSGCILTLCDEGVRDSIC